MRGAKKFFILLTIVAVVLGGLAIVAHAGTIIGQFEIDGNKIDESGAGQPYDWNSLPGAVIFTDPDPASGCPAGQDDQFSGGGSTEESPDTWIFSCGPSPSKDNFLEAGIGSRKIDGVTWLYLYFNRESESGSAVLNYEFNRSAETFTNSKGSVVPKRTAGDLLVNLSVDNGGANTTIDLYSWNGTHTAGNWSLISISPAPIRGTDWEVATDADSRGRFGFAELAINLPAFGVTPSCPGLGKAWVKSNSTHDFRHGVLKDRTVRKDVQLNNCAIKDWEFTVTPQGIAGTNVYAVYTAGNENRTLELTDPDGDGKYTGTDNQIPPGSVTFHFEVRNGTNVIYSTANGSESFVEGERKTNSGSLTYSISLTPEDAENFADSFAGKPQPHVLTAKVVNTANNQGLPFVPVNFANLGSCGSLSATSGTTNASGEVTTTLTSASPCSTSIRAWVNGTASGATAGFDSGEANDTASKKFVSYSLTMSPDAVNEVGKAHTFVVTLKKNIGDGNGDTPVSGASLSLKLDPASTDATISAVSNGTIGDPPTTATCTTDANGQCSVTINKPTPGAVALVAEYTATDSSQRQVKIDSRGNKQFLDFALSISNGGQTNVIGTDHTFTVTLTKDDGTNTTPLAGETVHLVLAPGTSDAHFKTINGDEASGTEADCLTKADGTCEVVITATTPGAVKLTASWSVELDSGTVTRTAEAAKLYVAFTLDVTPERAFNRVGEPHTFIVTLTQNDGSQTTRVAGETIHLSLNAGPTGAQFTNINGQPATGTEADCVTRSADDPATTDLNEIGTCALTFTAASAGTAVLTATWTKQIGGSSITLSDTGTKVFLAIDVTKASCPVATSPRGGIVDYTVSFSVGGAGLTNATFTDTLPVAVKFVSASTINGVTPQTPTVGGSGGTVRWSFPTIAEGNYTGTIRVTVASDAQLNTTVTNTATLDADEIDPESASHAITVTDGGRSASGRAYGLKADVLGSELIPPTPDSEDTNPGELLAVPDPFGNDTPLVRVLGVEESDNSTTDQAAYTSTATALGVDLNVPGVLHLKASSVVAKTASQASATGAGSTRGGSLIQDLWINDHRYGNVSEPTTVQVRDPLSGDVVAEVHLLETSRSGAAAGQAQPNADTEFASGMAVNGIHVTVHLLDLADVIVSHAETQAAFPSGLGCGAQIPAVSGSAFALGVNLKADSDDGIDLGNIKVAQVDLPITGGRDDATLADIDVPDVLTADVAEAHTIGEITDLDGDGVPVEADSRSRIAGLDLLAGTIKATVVEATSHSQVGPASTGSATIAHLEIGGTDVCEALGLTSVCTPEPNTVLLIPDGPVLVELNEQIPEPGGLTVNAVHIWILGKGNPFGLPVGAEIVIANAHSDAHPAGPTAVTDRQLTINVKALSAPSAKRLLQKVTPAQDFTLPQVVELPTEAPALSVQDIIRDPVSIVDELNTLSIAEEVLEDAEKLVQTLTDPEALLEALADPTTLLEGLEDPAAAIDALTDVVEALAGEPPAEQQPAMPAETETEQLEALLRRLAGL